MGKILSPCIKICCIDPVTGYCEGCFRTLEEIGKWTQYNEEERKRILEELPHRKANLFSTNQS